MSEEPFALTLHVPPPPAGDFDAIHSAVMETARGRWFLQEYARRHRNADTALVLAAIERIEAALRLQKSAPPSAGAAAASPASDLPLMEMRDAIVLTKENLSAIKPDGQSDFKTADFERIAGAIEAAATRLRTAGEHVQEVAWSMREQNGRPAAAGVNESRYTELETQAREIAKNCAVLEETGAGAKVVAALLQEIEARINAMLTQPPAQDVPEHPAAASEQPASMPTEMSQDVAAGIEAAESTARFAAEPLPATEATVGDATSAIATEEMAEAEPVIAADASEPLADTPEVAREAASTEELEELLPETLLPETAPTEILPPETVAAQSDPEPDPTTARDVTLVLTETLSIVVTPSATLANSGERIASAGETVAEPGIEILQAETTVEIPADNAMAQIVSDAPPEPHAIEAASVREELAAATETPSPIEPAQVTPTAGLAGPTAADAASPAPQQQKPARGMPGWLTMLAPLVRVRNALESVPPAAKIDFRLDGKLVTESVAATSANAAPEASTRESQASEPAETAALPEVPAHTIDESPAPQETSIKPLAKDTGNDAIEQARDILQVENASADTFAFQPAIQQDDSTAVPAPAAAEDEPADFLLEPWPRTPVHAQPQNAAVSQSAGAPAAAAAMPDAAETLTTIDTTPAALAEPDHAAAPTRSGPPASNPMSDAIARMAAASRPVFIPPAPVFDAGGSQPSVPASVAQDNVSSGAAPSAGMPTESKAPTVIAQDESNVLVSVIAPASPLKTIVAKAPFRPVQIAKPGDPLAPIIALSEEEKIALFS